MSENRAGERVHIGRSSGNELRLENETVSQQHAVVEVTPEGYLSLQDVDSANGTFLCRNERWVRVQRAVLSAGDRVRFGDQELALEPMLDLFEEHLRVRLRDAQAVQERVIFERPRRNPMTGNIEEKTD